jgi:hypothetical protein
MVITKFVYRRSWQANTINIKAFERDSIKKKFKKNEINYRTSAGDQRSTISRK